MWEFLPVAMSVIGSVMGATGNMQSGDAAQLIGRRQRQADEFQAAQLTQQAGQVFASAQRQDLEQVRLGKLVESKALANAAASGAGTGGNAMDIIANLHSEAAYRGSIALYNGEEQRRQLMMAAEAKRYEGALAEEAGNAKKTAYYTAGVGSLFKGAASLYTNYGGGGAKNNAPIENRTFDNTSSIGEGGINWDYT